MSQQRLPVPDTLRVELPLPVAFERWRDIYLHTAVEKLIVFLAFALLFYYAARLARQAIGRHIEDVNRRHALRKWVTYAYVVLLLLVAVALFADWLVGLGTIIAVLLAGIAFALQDVLKSIVGWFYLSSRGGVDIGSRIEVEGIVGDVIDIGVLKTTMLEVGGSLVFGRQSTGRLVTVPNYKILAEAVHIAPASSPFVWHEIQVTVTFESDWRRAEEILKELAEEIHAEVAPELERGYRTLERRYAFKYGTLTPIVYLSLGRAGVELTLRFLVHVRRRRGTVDRATRHILEALAREPEVRLAYPTYRVFRRGEADPDDAPGAAGTGSAPPLGIDPDAPYPDF